MSKDIEFDKCFDREKIKQFEDKIPNILEEINKLTSKEIKDFPKKVECMTEAEILAGELIGAGHGIYIRDGRIKVNPNMPSKAIALNYIHENLHHSFPRLSEKVIDILTSHIGCKTGIIEDNICDFFEKVE